MTVVGVTRFVSAYQVEKCPFATLDGRLNYVGTARPLCALSLLCKRVQELECSSQNHTGMLSTTFPCYEWSDSNAGITRKNVSSTSSQHLVDHVLDLRRLQKYILSHLSILRIQSSGETESDIGVTIARRSC